VLYRLSYVRLRTAGLEPATTSLTMKYPLPAQQADSTVKVRDNHRSIAGVLRGHDSNAVLLVQSQAWCLFHHLASVWTGGVEPPTTGSRSRCASIAPRPGGTDGRTRTDTDGGLSAVPLPLGYVSRGYCVVTGFLRGHVPASRPLRTSVTVDEEGLEPPASSV
jgi:hypothetical protein